MTTCSSSAKYTPAGSKFKTPFTNACRKGEILQIPIAHSDGNYYADAETLKELEDWDGLYSGIAILPVNRRRSLIPMALLII